MERNISYSLISSQEDLPSAMSSDDTNVSPSQISPTYSIDGMSHGTKIPHSKQVCAQPLSSEDSTICPSSTFIHFTTSAPHSPEALPWPDLTLTPLPFKEDNPGGSLYEGMRFIQNAFRQHTGLGSSYYQTSRTAQENKSQTKSHSMEPLPQVRLPVVSNTWRIASDRDLPVSSRIGSDRDLTVSSRIGSDRDLTVSSRIGSDRDLTVSSRIGSDRDLPVSSRSGMSWNNGSSRHSDKRSSSLISLKHSMPSSEFGRKEEEIQGSSLDQPAWIGSTKRGKSLVSTTFRSTHFCDTPYGEGVVLKLQRDDDDMMVVRLHWGSTAYIQAEDVKIKRIICQPNIDSLKTSLTDITRKHHLAMIKSRKNSTTTCPPKTLLPSFASTKALAAVVPDISTLHQTNCFKTLPDTFIAPQLAPVTTVETVKNVAFIKEVGEFQVKDSPAGITPIYRKDQGIPAPLPQPPVSMPRDNEDNDDSFKRQESSLLTENSGMQSVQSMGTDQQRQSTRSESVSLGGATSNSSSSSLHSWHNENQKVEPKPLNITTTSYVSAPGIVTPSKYRQSFLPGTNPSMMPPSHYPTAAVANGEINQFPRMDTYQCLTQTNQPFKRLHASVIR